MSYRDLEIWKLARQAAIAVHRMTLQELPKFEMYEEGSQIRRFDHLERLFETASLKNYRDLQAQLDLLGRKLNVFIEGVEREHISHPASRISDPASRSS